jgi:Glycosyltransferase family 87
VTPVRSVRVPLGRLAALGLVVVSVAATSVIVLAEPSLGPYPILAVLVVAFAALALVLAVGSLRRWLGVGTVLALSGGLLLGSALAPAHSSDDLWAYAMYGRTVVHHHENPYVHPPSDFPDDPLFEHVNPYWAKTTARYGPVFVGITAGVAVVAGDHPLPTRIAYQMIAGLAVFVALVLIARRVRSAAAVAIVGLNPVTAYMVVNAGHNDALVGLCVLGGVLLASRERHTTATLAFTAAALVKATAGLALLAYLAWLAYRRGPRALLRPVGVAVAVTIPMLLLAGFRDVINPVLEARETILPHSPWNLVAPGGISKAFWYGYEELGSQAHLSTYALVIVLAVAVIFVVSRLKQPTPLFVAAGALLAYLFASVYTAPWFAAWVLPLLALRWRWRVGAYALAFFAVVMIDDRFGNAVFPQVFLRRQTFQVLLANWINTLTMLVAIGGVAVLLWYRRPGSTPEEPQEPDERSEPRAAAPA